MYDCADIGGELYGNSGWGERNSRYTRAGQVFRDHRTNLREARVVVGDFNDEHNRRRHH
jgi:putative transposase